MLSDEEKQVVDYLIFHKYENSSKKEDMIDKVIEIIKKQSKEIEELKEKSNHITKETVEFVNSHYIHKGEIKAKIEEIDEVLKGQLIEKIRVYFEAQKEVLQSLLEKE